MPPTTTTCLMCNAPLPSHRARVSRFCSDPQCAWKYATLPRHQTCTECGRPLAPRELAAKVCGSWDCQESSLHGLRQERAERERQQLEDLQNAALKLRDEGAAAVGVREPAAYPLTLIPSFAAPVVNLPERRRRAHRDQVMRLLSQATTGRRAPSRDATGPEAAPAASPATTPEAQAVIGRVRAHCQGYCCRGGENHAYLSVATIRRYLDAHPGLRLRDVLAAYMDRVGHKTYKGSCIYHGPTGCTLSREMRSDICNDFFCGGLLAFRHNLRDDGPVRGFFASTDSQEIHGGAFVDESETRAVPMPTTGGADN